MNVGDMYKQENLDDIIKQYMPFIIKITSEFTGRYVSVENDEEFSIALLAFAKAYQTFQKDKGNFLTYARIIIERQLINYRKAQGNKNGCVSLDQLMDKGIEFTKTKPASNLDLQEEIEIYCNNLKLFGLDLEDMAKHAPKHKDTRLHAIDVAEQCSTNKTIVETTYRKRKLPIRAVANFTLKSEKMIKTSKIFILGTMIIFVKDLTYMIHWIMETRCHNVS